MGSRSLSEIRRESILGLDNIRLDLPIAGIGSNIPALAATDVIPVFVGDDPLVRVASLDGNGGVVLLGTVKVIGEPVVCDHVVELRRGLIIRLRPGSPVINRNGYPAVIAIHQSLGVCRVNPKCVMIAVRRWKQGKGLSSIRRAE